VSALLGADTRRLEVLADGLRGHSQDLQSLQIMAHGAVAEMRSAWAGPDFETVALRWEHEAGPRLTDVLSALTTMAGLLRLQAQEQRHTSDDAVALHPVDSGGGSDRASSNLVSGSSAGMGAGINIDVKSRGTPVRQLADRARDEVMIGFVRSDVGVEVAALSLQGSNDRIQHELSAAKAAAAAGYSVGLDSHGNLAASADASAAAYLGYAAGKVRGGSDLANGYVGAQAFVGARATADASGSIGPKGGMVKLGGGAFAGAKAEAEVSGTVAGATAAAGVEISYGIGAHANANAELSTSKIELSMDLGVTVGVGTGVMFDVSISPGEMMANVGHVFDELSDAR
jgi:hypothetical protein